MNQNKNNTLFINGDTFTYILIFMDVDQEKYQAKNKFGFWVQFKLIRFVIIKYFLEVKDFDLRLSKWCFYFKHPVTFSEDRFNEKKNPNAFCFLKSIRKKWGSECELEVSCHVQVRLRKRPSRNSKFGWQTFPWIIEVLMAENYSGTKGSWLFNDETTFTRYNFFTWHAQPN